MTPEEKNYLWGIVISDLCQKPPFIRAGQHLFNNVVAPSGMVLSEDEDRILFQSRIDVYAISIFIHLWSRDDVLAEAVKHLNAIGHYK